MLALTIATLCLSALNLGVLIAMIIEERKHEKL